MSNNPFILGFDDLSDEEKINFLNTRIAQSSAASTDSSSKNTQGLGGDLADMVQRGALQGVGGLFSLAEEFTGYGQSGADYFGGWADEQLDTLSPVGRESLSKEVFRNGENGLEIGEGMNPRTLAMMTAQGIGTTIPTLAGGGAFGVGAKLLGAGRGLASAASAAGAGAVGGGMAQGMAGQDARETVMNIPDETLYQSKAFLDLWNSDFYDESLDALANAAKVREHLAGAAASEVMRDPELAAVNFLSNAVMGKVFDGLLKGTLGKSRLGNAALVGVTEMGQEGLEEGAAAFSVNNAARNIDPTITDDNVLPQALTGAVVGFGIGAPLGLAGRVDAARKKAAEEGADPLEQELAAANAAATGDVRSGQSINTNFDIEALNARKAELDAMNKAATDKAFGGPREDYSQRQRSDRNSQITGEGIDADIAVFKKLGDNEAVELLGRIKKIRERAYVAKQAGRDEMAKRLYGSADELYTQAFGAAPYSDLTREGEFIPGDKFPAAMDYREGDALNVNELAPAWQSIGHDNNLGIENTNRPGGVILAGMPEDYAKRRQQKFSANADAYEGQFAAPDDTRINKILERRAIIRGRMRDEEVEKAELPTPRLDAVRAQGLDERFADDRYRDRLMPMVNDLVDGGGIALLSDEHGRINGRTKSQNPDWFRENEDLPSKGFVKQAVVKALSGAKMGAKQARAISAMLDAIDAERSRYDTDQDRAEWDSLFDEAAFLDSVNPDTETELDNWIGESGAYLFDPGKNAPLRTIAMLWEEALNRGVTQDELEAIDRTAKTTEQLARAIYERYQGNTETAISGNNESRERAEAQAGRDAGEIQGRAGSEESILSQYTEQELADRAKAQADADAAAQSAKAQVDKDLNDFTLSGSGLPADIASSRGQNSLLGAPKRQAKSLRGEKLDGEWRAFAVASGSKNIPRSAMPQVKAEHRGALANFLKARGITGTEETVAASELKPTQAEFSEAKVQKAKEFTGGDRAILVSQDGHVVDGHHQWIAKHDNNEDVRVIRLGAPIEELLEQVKEFPSAEVDRGAKESRTSQEPKASNTGAAPGGKPGVALGNQEKAGSYGKGNKVFTEDAAEKAKALLRAKFGGQLNSGLDPEMVQAGITLAGYHIEAGARAFTDFAKAMIGDLGEAVKPHLRSWYEAIRYHPELDSTGMTPAAEIDNIDFTTLEGESNAEHSATSQKPDSAGINAPSGSSQNISNDGRGPGRRGAVNPSEETSREQGSGNTVGDRGANDVGKRGDKPVRSEKSRLEDGATGSIDDSGSLPDSTGGLLTEQDSSEGVSRVIKKAPTKTGGVTPSELGPVTKGSLSEIKAQMPFLTEGQALDVVFAEKRFSKPDGYGVLFTNGTGTGKTFSGLGVALRMVKEGKSNILIAVPKQTIADAWIKAGKLFFGLDITRLADTKDAGQGIVITTYANLGDNMAVVTRDWDAVIADEAHYLSSDQKGSKTGALNTLRAMTLKRGVAHDRVHAKEPEKYAELLDLEARIEAHYQARTTTNNAMAEKLDKEAQVIRKHFDERAKVEQARIDKVKPEDRPRAVFLSATPFAYEKSVGWAQEFLFDWGQAKRDSMIGYNEGTPYEKFMITHFGYRMRYNKLTEPDAKVDRGLMQRAFNSWLKKEGVLSGRALESDFDYDRRFVMMESQLGRRVDLALDWLRNTEGRSDIERVGLSRLQSRINGAFDYHSRMYFLEAIKAREAIPYIQAHLDAGRKVLVMHDFKQGGTTNPFIVRKIQDVRLDKDGEDEFGDVAYNALLDEFRQEFSDLISAFDKLPSVLDTMRSAFPDALIYNGDVSAKKRVALQNEFNNDEDTASSLMVAQGDAMREGVSIHDTTGKFPRVMIHLGMPVKPTSSIQQEGRTYRTGQASDAMFRYFTIGTNWERYAFASKIASRAGTAENLAMGELARGLKHAFINAYEEAGDFKPGFSGEGKGGKALDQAYASILTPWDMAKSLYFGVKQQGSGRSASGREHSEYFATPEPLGMKMVEWADIQPGESTLEPSAGHGAIARWLPENATNRAIEFTDTLGSRLALHFDGDTQIGDFLEHNVVNKYDAIVMNPPFGVGGADAVAHVAKAMTHLRDGGRIVALIPTGPAADKKFEKLLSSKEAEQFHLAAEIKLPSVTFERAGTKVATRVIVLERQRYEYMADKVQQETRDYSDATTIDEFFDRLETSEIRPRLQTEGSETTSTDNREYGVTKNGGNSFEPKAEMESWEAKHSQTGEDLFMAAAGERISKEAFAQLRSLAKEHGGYWSRFGKAGFLFKTQAERDKFVRATGASGISENTGSALYSSNERDTQDIRRGQRGANRITEPAADQQPAQGDLFNQLAKKSVAATEFYSKAALREVDTVKTGVEFVKSPQDAAHVLSSFRKNAQENMLVLVLDKDDRPLSVIRHTKGAMDSASVNPEELAGAVAATPGAAKIYLGHNHPSGMTKPSDADRMITDKIVGTLEPSGIDTMGHVILGEGAGAYFFDDLTTGNPIMVKPLLRKRTVPVTESKIIARSKQTPITSADIARVAVKDLPSGVLFLNTQNAPAAFVPMTTEELSGLRGDGYRRLLETLNNANAKTAILNIDADEVDAAINASRAINNIGMRVLDVFIGGKSNAAVGGRLNKEEGIFYSRTSELKRGATPKGVGRGAAKIAINKFLKQYKGADDVTVKVFRTHEEAHGTPAPFRTKGGYDPKTDTLFVYTEALDSLADLEETLQHELLVHKGLGFIDPVHAAEFLTSLRNAAKDSPELASVLDEVERVESGRSDQLKAEEILARIAQEKLTFTDKVWNRIVLALQRLLKRAGFNVDVSAHRQGKDLVYRIGDAFAEGRRALRRDVDDIFNQTTDKPAIVAELTGDEIRFEAGSGAIAAARQYYRDNIQGTTVTRSEVGEVRFSGKGWHKLKRGLTTDDLRVKLIPALKEIVGAGQYHGREALYKERSDSIVAFHFFSAYVSIAGKTVEAGVSVAEDAHGNLFYNLNHDTDALWEKIKPQYQGRFNSRSDAGALGDRNSSGSEAQLSGLNITILSSFDAVNQGVGGSPDQVLYSRSADISPERVAVLSKIGMAPDNRSSAQKVKDTLSDWWAEVMESFIPAVADKFYDLKKISTEAYMRARMSTNTGAALAAALGHATPEWHQDGLLKAKRGSKGLLEILKRVDGETNEWIGWMVGKRAESLMAQGRENLLTAEDIATLLDVSPEQAQRFQATAEEWQAYNGAMLDIMAGGGLITQEDADYYKQDPYYIPFYREVTDETGEVDVTAPFTKKGLSHQKDGIEKLKGGTSNLQDPLKNMLMNVSRAIDASVKNNALRRIIDEVNPGADNPILTPVFEGNRSGPNVIRVRRDGENEWYRVHDLGVLGALTAMNDIQTSALTRALGIPKRLLTAGVTATPTFMLRNAVRDITASWVQSEDVKWQASKALGQFRDALKIDDDTLDMMMAGSAFMGGYRYSNDATSNAQALREQLRAKGMSTGEIDGYLSSIWDGSKAKWEWYREKGERFENMARLKMFKDSLASGHNYFESAYKAKDLMDFSLHGRNSIMHFLIQTVPFMNARIQGLYKLGRVGGNAKNDATLRKLLAVKGASLMAVSLALYAINEDDEKYQELPDWDKDANWHLFFEGEHIRIPKPFELGLVFGTIPERMARLSTGDDDARVFFKSLSTNVLATLSMNPVPQALMPIGEAAFNYDLFRGRTIDNQSDLSNLPGSRKSNYTSEVAKGMGALFESMGITGDMASPKRIDHIIKGYTGSMGISFLSGVDAVIHLLSGNTMPAMNQRDYPVIGWFAQGDDPVGTKYSDDFYRLLERANQAYRTARDPNTDSDRRERIMEDYAPELRARQLLNTTSKALSTLRKQRDAIYKDNSLSADEKRNRLNRIQEMTNAIQKRAVVAAGGR